MPAARADHQHRRIVADRVVLAAVGVGEVETAEPAIAQVDLALDQLVPYRRGGVLEIGHENFGARIERVDDHLGVGRAGDLDPAVLEVGRDAGDGPFALADVARLLEEIGQIARIELRLPLEPPGEQRLAPLVEAFVKLGEEVERVFGQDLVGAGNARRLRDDARASRTLAHARGFLGDHVAGRRQAAVAEGQPLPFGPRAKARRGTGRRSLRCRARLRRIGSCDIRRR